MFFAIFKISGHSMEPTIQDNQMVFVSRLPFLLFKPRIGDIIAFRNKDQVFIKRIIKINSEKYFIAGDNKKDSFDSRRLGWIDKKQILGKVIINSKFKKF